MTDRKPCVRCERPIDRYAKLCVYCNWEQMQAYTPPPASAGAPAYVPPPDNRARNRLLMIGGGVALIILAFCVGTWIHGFEPKELKEAEAKQQQQTASAPAQAPQRSNVTLVPATDGPPSEIEQPLTSAPPQVPGQDASDATALPSEEYAAMAAKAKAQRQATLGGPAPMDPRDIRGRAYEEPLRPSPAPAQNVPMASSMSARTAAYPEYKPVPSIYVTRETKARLNVTVGSDGRVKDIDIVDPIPGATGRLIQAVQTWRFKPATENGVPVPARVAVTITLHSNG
jgi:TonB family protein